MNPISTPAPAPAYVEAFPHGDGHFHECASCGGTVGESSALLVVDGAPWHAGCFE